MTGGRRRPDAEPSRRQSQARDAVVAFFEDYQGFASATQVHEAAALRRPQLSRATVYRAIRLLLDDGLLDVVVDARGRSTYRRCQRRDHHSHLTCTGCGVVVELDPPDLTPLRVAAMDVGCTDVTVAAVVRGRCPECPRRGPEAAGEAGATWTVARRDA